MTFGTYSTWLRRFLEVIRPLEKAPTKSPQRNINLLVASCLPKMFVSIISIIPRVENQQIKPPTNQLIDSRFNGGRTTTVAWSNQQVLASSSRRALEWHMLMLLI